MLQLAIPFDALPLPVEGWKQKALAWAAANHEVVAFYEPNAVAYRHGAFENMLGVQLKAFSKNTFTTWEELSRAQLTQQHKPVFGYFTFDLKNSLEKLSSQNPDHIGFPELYFFHPDVWLQWKGQEVTLHSDLVDPKEILEQINNFPFSASFSETSPKTQARVPKEKYLETVEKLRQHILEGDVYEVNYCQEFYAENAAVEPVALFQKLNAASPTPFAGFLKLQEKYLLCASPERFLKKEGDLLISQPIKGTIARGKTPKEDESQKQALANSEKERAENMMIVDLVRNDLNRVAATGTVQVVELFGLYGFQYVWQMISTVTARLPAEVNAIDAIKAAFPMGSMTGAPKIKALELIELYENTKRGLYSGSLGYFLPIGDFDFNVVIRSLQYNASNGYLSFEVGSAITYDSDPVQEYEECLLKAAAILKVLA
ncbi:anthranilate synthase component I family protein [Rufibacter sp. LB8]|uniref:anthranilate synthase component I family protein n=1 Tax=Rufibacter sp. LB8 TaxID=2777781 RepID=UPI00178C1CC3|nr:anthranilate synthase component I family protein [Rufibacter sp. LB8]